MVGATADGAIGPATLRAVETYVKQEGLKGAIEKYQKDRLAYYKKLKHFKTFGKGWTRRNKETTAAAKKMI
jgi:lysozyme family protein